MGKLHHEIEIDAPVTKVWRVLADLEGVQNYNPAVAKAHCTSPVKQGVGASRHCDLKPKGWVRERVTVWEPERAVGLEVTESEWPIVFMRWRTDVQPHGSGTLVKQDFEYQLKFGLLGNLMDALMMRRKLNQGLNDIFASMKRYIEYGELKTPQGAVTTP